MEFFYFKKDVEAAFIKMMEAGKLFTVNVDNDFSVSQRNELIVKVDNKTFKIKF